MANEEPIHWYVIRGDEQVGPVSPAQLKAMVDSGEIQRDTILKRSDSGKQLRACRVRGLFPLPPAPPPPIARSPVTRPPASHPKQQHQNNAARPSIGALVSRLPRATWIIIFVVCSRGLMPWLRQAHPEIAQAITDPFNLVVGAVVILLVLRFFFKAGEESSTPDKQS